MIAGPDTAVLLLNLGGPLRARDVEGFLYRLFVDRDIIKFPGPAFLQPLYATLLSKGRRKEVEGRYMEIGGGSPILRETALQAAALRSALREAGRREPVKIVFRYTAPRAAGVLRSLRRQGIRRLLPVTLYPHDCQGTTGSSLSELSREAGAAGLELLPGVLHYATDPHYLDSLAAPLAAAQPADQRGAGEKGNEQGGDHRATGAERQIPEQIEQVNLVDQGIEQVVEHPVGGPFSMSVDRRL